MEEFGAFLFPLDDVLMVVVGFLFVYWGWVGWVGFLLVLFFFFNSQYYV